MSSCNLLIKFGGLDILTPNTPPQLSFPHTAVLVLQVNVYLWGYSTTQGKRDCFTGWAVIQVPVSVDGSWPETLRRHFVCLTSLLLAMGCQPRCHLPEPSSKLLPWVKSSQADLYGLDMRFILYREYFPSLRNWPPPRVPVP